MKGIFLSVLVFAIFLAGVAGAHCPTPQNYGDGSPGAGGFVPAIGFVGVPHPGNGNFEMNLVNAVGGATGFLAIGLNGAKIPVNGIEILLDPTATIVILPATTGGAPGAAGAGTASFSFPIPMTVPPNGTQVFAQWFLFDPGAPAGLAASNGLVVHLHYC